MRMLKNARSLGRVLRLCLCTGAGQAAVPLIFVLTDDGLTWSKLQLHVMCLRVASATWTQLQFHVMGMASIVFLPLGQPFR